MDIHELVSSTKELIKNLISRSTELSALYTNLNYEQANGRLVFLTEDLSTLLNAIAVLNEKYTDMEVEELQEKLTLLLDVLGNEDYFLVSDLLIFEINPLLESWEAYLVNA